jgi:hypothetical protein
MKTFFTMPSPSDARTLSETEGIEEVRLPEDAIQDILDSLRGSMQSLPLSSRTFRDRGRVQWMVGLLERFERWEGYDNIVMGVWIYDALWEGEAVLHWLYALHSEPTTLYKNPFFAAIKAPDKEYIMKWSGFSATVTVTVTVTVTPHNKLISLSQSLQRTNPKRRARSLPDRLSIIRRIRAYAPQISLPPGGSLLLKLVPHIRSALAF